MVSLPLLIVVERRTAEPILPFSLILSDPIAMKCLLLGAGSQVTQHIPLIDPNIPIIDP
jgi:hypothetical protein